MWDIWSYTILKPYSEEKERGKVQIPPTICFKKLILDATGHFTYIYRYIFCIYIYEIFTTLITLTEKDFANGGVQSSLQRAMVDWIFLAVRPASGVLWFGLSDAKVVTI